MRHDSRTCNVCVGIARTNAGLDALRLAVWREICAWL